MPSNGVDRLVGSLRSSRRAMLVAVVVFLMLVALLFVSSQSYGVAFESVIPTAPTTEKAVALVPKTEDLKGCRTTCVKGADGKLFEFAQFRRPEEYPIPVCRNANANATQTGASTVDMCSTWCSKDDTSRLAEIAYSGLSTDKWASAACPREEIEARPMPPEGGKHVYTWRKQQWVNWENLAEHCNDQHVLDRTLYHDLDKKTLHIVYFTWLPENQNPRKIIPEQMKDVIASGLFDRPNTKLYVVVSTEFDAEYDWFINQEWVKKYKPEMVRARKNQHEFAATRFLWELACKHTDDLFLYFHSKGARYGRGRIGMEVILTREIVVEWRLMLNLLIAHPSSLSFGLGGPGWQWMNFYFARGSLFLTVPKPVPVENRYWYEDWIGYDIREQNLSLSPNQVSLCSQATGMEAALKEPTVPLPRFTREGRDPQYGILRCGQAMTEYYQLDMWSVPAAKRMDEFLALQARIRNPPK